MSTNEINSFTNKIMTILLKLFEDHIKPTKGDPNRFEPLYMFLFFDYPFSASIKIFLAHFMIRFYQFSFNKCRQNGRRDR